MKDLEFHVSREGSTETLKVLKSFADASQFAVSAAVDSGTAMVIDVVTWSQPAARAWGGEAAVEIYQEDPDSSVHERIVIKAESQGPVR
jgi:hypothetical protein